MVSLITLLARLESIATGAFGAHPDHDAHLLSTLSAIQILVTQDALDRLDIPRVVKCRDDDPTSRFRNPFLTHKIA